MLRAIGPAVAVRRARRLSACTPPQRNTQSARCDASNRGAFDVS